MFSLVVLKHPSESKSTTRQLGTPARASAILNVADQRDGLVEKIEGAIWLWLLKILKVAKKLAV